MRKHRWEKAWEDKKFNIETLIPSVLVSRYGKHLKRGDYVLDVGCGNGRNSIYLAGRGCEADCFDVADLKWKKNAPVDTQRRIHFLKSSISNYHFIPLKYKTIIVTRVIQYLDEKELEFLLKKVVSSLAPGGFLLVSYSTQGGIFNRKEIDVPKHQYSLKKIKTLLKDRFKKVVVTQGSKRNRHVNYSGTVRSYDIYVSGPKIV